MYYNFKFVFHKNIKPRESKALIFSYLLFLIFNVVYHNHKDSKCSYILRNKALNVLFVLKFLLTFLLVLIKKYYHTKNNVVIDKETCYECCMDVVLTSRAIKCLRETTSYQVFLFVNL